MAEMYENRRASYDPSKKKQYIEQMHRKDMQNVQFCALNQFSCVMSEKQVRERAIRERIEAIKQSHNMKFKFDEEFTQAKKVRKQS